MSDKSRAARKSTRSARILTARRPGRCAESGTAFSAGESILWIPPTRPQDRGLCYRLESATAVAWFDNQPNSFDVPADDFDMAFEDRCRDACGL
jgi:hypothetical protein